MDPRPFVLPAVVLGVGLGGLADGIVLHQILQWHHIASAVQPPTDLAALEHNTLLDGIFHAAAWLMTLAGVFLLWRAADMARARPPTAVLFGGLLVGWATFNLVEGLLDHYLLGVHHVREGADAAVYDAALMLLSAGLFVVGSSLLRAPLRARSTGADAGNGDTAIA